MEDFLGFLFSFEMLEKFSGVRVKYMITNGLDQSGNTGNIELRKNLNWNFNNQTHFALGAFYMRESIVYDIEKAIIDILHKYDAELGAEKGVKLR